jgi:hypothetical protein
VAVLRNVRLEQHQRRRRRNIVRAHRLAHAAGQQLAHLPNWHHVVDTQMAQRRQRHAGVQGFLRILHHRHPATRCDRDQPRRAVVEHAGQHDTGHPRAERPRRGAEQGVDGGPVAVLGGAVRERQLVIHQQQVVVGWGDVHVAVP